MTYPYKVAPLHDNRANTVLLTPEPASPNGIVYPEFVETIGGTTLVDGAPYLDVYFYGLTPEEYLTLLAQHGLSTTDVSHISTAVTVELPGPDRTTFTAYNATVVHKRGGGDAVFENHVYRQVHFRYRKLEESS